VKAITISQPHASRIARGDKWVENRPYEHPWLSARGPIAIHAGQGTQYLSRSELKNYTTGAVVAVARLSAVVQLDVIRKNLANALLEAAAKYPTTGSLCLCLAGTRKTVRGFLDHPHTEGPFCLIFEHVEPLARPIPARGFQGAWRWEPPKQWDTVLLSGESLRDWMLRVL
jgi:hypothetical protein